MSNDSHRIESLAELRQVIDEPNPVTRQKVFEALDEQMQAFVARAPFCLLATADADVQLEVSPKGDVPGFVQIEDARTLLLPDRKGNKLLFGLQNILANPRVALVFLVPGTGETLRVHGSADLTADPAILERLRERGQPALLAIRVRVDACFFHCAKAFKRSRLWEPASWPAPLRVSFGKLLARKLGGGAELEGTIDRMIEDDYKNNL